MLPEEPQPKTGPTREGFLSSAAPAPRTAALGDAGHPVGEGIPQLQQERRGAGSFQNMRDASYRHLRKVLAHLSSAEYFKLQDKLPLIQSWA